MVVSINSNFAAVNAQTNVAKANDAVSRNIAQLSSGQRITQAKDDVAGLAIGTSLKTGVSTLKAAVTNTAQANALLGLADGAVNSISDILARQKSLASQATAGTLNEDTRGFLDQEFQALSLEINRIAGNANFNGIKLLDGSASGSTLQATTAPTGTANYSNTGTLGNTIVAASLTFGTSFSSANALGKDVFSGLQATFAENTNDVLFELQLGDKTYSATVGTADLGGTDDVTVTLSAGTNDTITFDIADANTDAATDAATTATLLSQVKSGLSGTNIYQTREVSSFSGTGAAEGLTATISSSEKFKDLQIDNISGTSTSATSSSFSVRVNDELFTGNIATDNLANLADLTLTSTTDSNKKIILTNGGSAISLANAAEVDTFVSDLKSSFGVGSGLSFQTGVEAANTINVTLGDVQTASLYKDDNGASQSIDIKTLENAQTAGNVLDNAINKVIAERATIGALQSRFDFAQSALKTSLTNQDSARAVFLDTDVSETSTEFALNNVKLQAGVSVQAQANQQTQNLLKLIG